jgi:hypothetical protein
MAELEQKIIALETQIQDAKKPTADIPPQSEPITPPADKPQEPKQCSSEEEMAIFMLDYIINNPKSKAQDIVKAWIESKKGKAEPPKEEPAYPLPKPAEPKPAEEPKPTEPKPSEPSKYPYPEKMNEVMDKLSSIVDKLTKLSAEEELKMSIKSRDDQILALQTQIKSFSQSEKKDDIVQKTVQSTSEIDLEKDGPIRIERGTVYFKD